MHVTLSEGTSDCWLGGKEKNCCHPGLHGGRIKPSNLLKGVVSHNKQVTEPLS